MKRSTIEMWETKNRIINEINGLQIAGYKLLGRSDEGLVYQNDKGQTVVLQVMCKQPKFNPMREISWYMATKCNRVQREWWAEYELTRD